MKRVRQFVINFACRFAISRLREWDRRSVIWISMVFIPDVNISRRCNNVSYARSMRNRTSNTAMPHPGASMSSTGIEWWARHTWMTGYWGIAWCMWNSSATIMSSSWYAAVLGCSVATFHCCACTTVVWTGRWPQLHKSRDPWRYCRRYYASMHNGRVQAALIWFIRISRHR